jgi:hypothetical protein
MNSFHIRPGNIQLVIGDPIPVAQYGRRDAEALAARAQKAVEDLYYARSAVQDPRQERGASPIEDRVTPS